MRPEIPGKEGLSIATVATSTTGATRRREKERNIEGGWGNSSIIPSRNYPGHVVMMPHLDGTNLPRSRRYDAAGR